MWFRSPHPLSDFAAFDDAGEGGKGPLHLLWKLRGRSVILPARSDHKTYNSRSLLANLGALSVLTIFFVDPFFQQLVTVYNCGQQEPFLNATVPRSSYYSINDFEDSDRHAAPPLSVKNAVYAGLFSAVDDFQIRPSCYTGSCNIGLYDTIGFCSSCTDISGDIVRQDVQPSGTVSSGSSSPESKLVETHQSIAMLRRNRSVKHPPAVSA